MSDSVKHPAVYSKSVLDKLHLIVNTEVNLKKKNLKILDPFVGVGKFHELGNKRVQTWGIELEPEWACQHKQNIIGDATFLPFGDCTFDAVITSCSYGNRMADAYDGRDGSKRRTYRICLGRLLSANSGSAMQWGENYRDLHTKAIVEAFRVTVPGGLICINMKNHVRKGKQQRVIEWWISTMLSKGGQDMKVWNVKTPGYRYGANSKARMNKEAIIMIRKPE